MVFYDLGHSCHLSDLRYKVRVETLCSLLPVSLPDFSCEKFKFLSLMQFVLSAHDWTKSDLCFYLVSSSSKAVRNQPPCSWFLSWWPQLTHTYAEFCFASGNVYKRCLHVQPPWLLQGSHSSLDSRLWQLCNALWACLGLLYVGFPNYWGVNIWVTLKIDQFFFMNERRGIIPIDGGQVCPEMDILGWAHFLSFGLRERLDL